MRACAIAIALVASGCSLLFSPSDSASESADAAPVDDLDAEATDAAVHPACDDWVPRYFACSLIDADAGDLTIRSGQYTLDTETGNSDIPGAPTGAVIDPLSGNVRLRVLAFDNLVVDPGATIRVTGPHPLVITAWSSITMNGTIDASSSVASDEQGPGAARAGESEPFCASSNAGAEADGGGGGGGGGTLGGRGGFGGDGDQSPGTGGMSAIAPSPAEMETIHAGCRGGGGGHSTIPADSAAGSGGGAVYFASPNTITVSPDGQIFAGGAGGAAGSSVPGGGGGGGGGSGGFIGFEADTLTVRGATVLMNGGGGGGGDSFASDDPAFPGDDATTTFDPGASGGQGGDGADGGVGGAGLGPAGGAGTSAGVEIGGGGGGGGVGVIGLFSPNLDFFNLTYTGMVVSQ